MKCKLSFLLPAFVMASGLSFGDVAPPYPYVLSQSDGLTFEARMFGDERLNWVETMDGRIILDVTDDENQIWWCYATVDSEGFYAPSEVLVGAETAEDLLALPDREDALQQQTTRLRGKFRYAADIDRPRLSGPVASPLAASGICKPLVFLVDFRDDQLPVPSHKYTKAQFAQLLFANNLSPYSVTPALPSTYTISLRDYYNEVSAGKFTVSGSAASVADWTTANNDYGYYVDQAQGMGSGPNGRTHSADAVCVEIARKLDQAVNYADFDGNGDGIVDVVILIMEGWASGADNQFWSFQGTLSRVADIDPTAPTDTNGFLLLDGVTIREFIVTTEQVYGEGWPDFAQGDIRPIGTFCHEMGHVLGLPDLYDTDSWYDENRVETIHSSGIGVWGLMGSGGYNRQTSPAYPCAWSRARLNWITMQTHATNLRPTVLSVPPTENNHVAYKILIDPSDASEYFLLENRQPIGSDQHLWGKGLLIWHIDESFTDMFPGQNRVNSWESTFGVSLMQADGMGHLYMDRRPGSNANDGDAGDPFPGTTSKNRFTVGTNPSASSYLYDRDADGTVDAGYASEVSITNITESAGGAISCTVSSPNPRGFELGYDEGGYTRCWAYPVGSENRAGILVTPLNSSLLRNLRTVFIDLPSGGDQVISYIVRVWEGFDETIGWPQALIHEQSGTVNWSASPPPRKYGGWVTIPINRTISCRSSSKYYIEIQYVGPGYIMPSADSIYTNVAPSGKSFTRGAGSATCTLWSHGDWNIRAVFEEVAAPASLAVTPPEGLTATGNQGGPFNPSSKTYTLTNTGGTPLNWQASKSQAWVSLDQAGGTLAAGGSTTVTVSVNSNANGLGAGSYSDTVYFTNLTNNNGSTTRSVSLQISSAQKVATPTFNPSGGMYTSPLTVTISCTTSSATIRYTTDGSTPTETSPQYAAPISISTTTTLKARAWRSGWTPSDVASATYTIQGGGIVILEDTWPSYIDDGTKWTTHGTRVDDRGENEPSPPYSLHFNAGDSIRSKKIDLSVYSRAVLTYYYEQTGSEESPDDGDDLVSMYWNGSSYTELRRHLGSGPDMNYYEKVTVTLPSAAMHRNFMLRFESRGDSYWYGLYDDWFIDNVELRVWP